MELTDLTASFSSIPDCSSFSSIPSAALLSMRARSPLPIPSLMETAKVPLPSSTVLKLSPDSISPPLAAPATPVLTS
ncbi:hypothetical protein D3C87_1464070 [compost metagenome]